MTFKLLVGECSLSSRTFEWTTLLHVCDAWYHQIMNTPRFWSVVDLNLPFASRMMALSKAAPLQVSVRVPPDAGESLWSLVAKALSPRHRLQELTILLPDSKAFSRAFNSVPPNSTAPYLEHLTIDVANVEGKFSGYFWTDLPSLRSLSLANTPLPWETHSMPNLVILDIGTQQYDHRPTISWLLTALKYMPHIQTISVSRLRASNVDPRAPPITLPCLKNLHVGSDDASTLSILNRLFPPALVAAEFRYKDVDTKTLLATDLSALRCTVSRVMATSTSITSVSISFNDMFRIEVVPSYVISLWFLKLDSMSSLSSAS
ncbi:hypothetical protein ONZ45_g3080 [Pleurotus djamor]|nr:hypothetical protein ONZ45_g3080 [Pleurotus djamor]